MPIPVARAVVSAHLRGKTIKYIPKTKSPQRGLKCEREGESGKRHSPLFFVLKDNHLIASSNSLIVYAFSIMANR